MVNSKKGSQLSLFRDSDVRRSFISRFSINPRRELIRQLRMENLFGVRNIINVTGYCGMSHISANRHFINKHKPFVKEGRKYYYD